MARPKVIDENLRSFKFTLRLTPAEQKQLRALTEITGKSPTALIRHKVFNGKFPEPGMPKLDRDTYFQLKKIGVNLNQLTRSVNTGIVPNSLLAGILQVQAQQELIIKLLLNDRESEDR